MNLDKDHLNQKQFEEKHQALKDELHRKGVVGVVQDQDAFLHYEAVGIEKPNKDSDHPRTEE